MVLHRIHGLQDQAGGRSPGGGHRQGLRWTPSVGQDWGEIKRGYTLTQGTELLIDKSLTLDGAGSGDTIIQAAASSADATSRVRNITQSGRNVAISDVTIRHGRATAGGGIVNGGTLTITTSTVSGNEANEGGGIYNDAGTLTLTNSTISDNTASQRGGGIYNSGPATISNSTISGNTAVIDGGGGIYNSHFGRLTITNSILRGNTGGEGGGIFNTEGTLTLTISTISGNMAGARRGGGISIDFGTVTITNSTLSGNTAVTYGGGVYSVGTLTLTNSTITGNVAETGSGGGIRNVSATLELVNTIIAANTAATGPDCSGIPTSLGYNLIGDDTACGLSPATGDLVNIDPKLGPLQDNGGPTLTHALLPGSPAIDAGDDSVLGPPHNLATDQRGPGFPRLKGADVDIGAYEVQRTDAGPAANAIYFSDSYTSGIIRRLEASGKATPVYESLTAWRMHSIGFDDDGRLYFSNHNDFKLHRVVDGSAEVVHEHDTYLRDFAFDSLGRVYFSEATGAGADGKIYRIDDGSVSLFYSVKLSDIGFWAGNFTFDEEDTLYLSHGNKIPAGIFKIVNDTPTLVFDGPGYDITGLEFDDSGNILYTARLLSDSSIYRLDPSTGEPTLVFSDPQYVRLSDVALGPAPLVSDTCNGLTATIVGSPGTDHIMGTSGDDVIVALGGDDTVLGMGGNDTICLGDGDDFGDGGPDRDRIFGERDDDVILGGKGRDWLHGGEGEDFLRGGRGKDRLWGGRHDDFLKGGKHADRLYGQKGDDVLVGGKGNDRLFAHRGDDILLGRAGDDTHNCGPGYDFANGGQGTDTDDGTCEATRNIGGAIPPPEGMVSWWPGDGNAQDIWDGNHGVLVGGTTFTGGKVGQAFSFDNSLNSGVLVADSPNLNPTEALTIDAWVKPSSFPNAFPTVVRKRITDPQYLLAVTDQGQAHCNIGGPGADPVAGLVSLNEWAHLACTYDRVAVRLFVNGAEVATSPATQPIPTTSAPLGIGKLDGATTKNFDGLIDEVEIFNRALTAAEIKAIYDAGSAGKLRP